MRSWVIALTFFLACARDPQVHARTSVEDGIAQSDQLLTRFLPADKPGCSGAFAQNGTVLWAGAHGLANLSTKTPLTPDSVFDIASTSKQFTALAVLLLAQEGALALSDTLSTHVAGLPSWANDVTLEQVMHHRSGIPDYTDRLISSGHSLSSSTTQADAIAVLANTALEFKPDTSFHYSNSNYILLAEVVQSASKQPLPDFLAARVFSPLKLDMRMDAAFSSPETAVPYTAQPFELLPSRSGWLQLGDGSIFTTPTQLARWGDHYRTGTVGGPELLASALASAVMTDVTNDRYGPGIDVAADGSLSHSGSWSGFVTAFFVTPDRSGTLAISCNSASVDLATVGAGLQTIWLSP